MLLGWFAATMSGPSTGATPLTSSSGYQTRNNHLTNSLAKRTLIPHPPTHPATPNPRGPSPLGTVPIGDSPQWGLSLFVNPSACPSAA